MQPDPKINKENVLKGIEKYQQKNLGRVRLYTSMLWNFCFSDEDKVYISDINARAFEEILEAISREDERCYKSYRVVCKCCGESEFETYSEEEANERCNDLNNDGLDCMRCSMEFNYIIESDYHFDPNKKPKETV